LQFTDSIDGVTVLVLNELKKNKRSHNATATPVFYKYFALFKKVAHSWEPGETRFTRLQTMYNDLKFSEK